MERFTSINLREHPDLKDRAAEWFHRVWGVPVDAYRACMEAYLDRTTEYGWYLCLDDDRIVSGLGVIENDFHDRKDLAPTSARSTRRRHTAAGASQGGFSTWP